MKTQTASQTYTVGSVTFQPYVKHTATSARVTFQPYVKFGPHIQPAPNGRELAELYDKAARQIELLVHALKLCAPLTKLAEDARNAAFDAVMEDLKS